MDNKSISIGILESYGYIGAVVALDTALKCADVKLLGCELVSGGIVTVVIEGDVASVQCAVDAAEEADRLINVKLRVHVIPRLSIEVNKILPNSSVKYLNDKHLTKVNKEPQLSREELSAMKVEKLRTIARKLNVMSINRNKIKYAKKNELIDAICEDLKGRD